MLWKISFLLCADFTEGHSKTGVEILEKRADILRETCARDFHISPQKGRFKGHHDILVSFQGLKKFMTTLRDPPLFLLLAADASYLPGFLFSMTQRSMFMTKFFFLCRGIMEIFCPEVALSANNNSIISESRYLEKISTNFEFLKSFNNDYL